MQLPGPTIGFYTMYIFHPDHRYFCFLFNDRDLNKFILWLDNLNFLKTSIEREIITEIILQVLKKICLCNERKSLHLNF